VNEYLVIRLGEVASDPIAWLVWSSTDAEVIASGTLAGVDQLGELQTRAGGRPLYVLVPASELVFRQLSLPGKVNRRSLQALPYLLEEEVAGDVEQLHLVILGRDGPRVQVAAVEKARLQQWLGWLAEAGLKPKQLMADVLALPLQSDAWSAVKLGEQWLLRQDATSGLVAEESWLAALLASYVPPPSVASFSPPPVEVAGQWQVLPPELPMQLLAQGATEPRFNLLQGAFRLQPEWARLLLPWRKVMLAAAACLALLLANRGLELYQLQQTEQALAAQMVQLYKRLFPGETRVVNPRAQLRQHLLALQGGGGTQSPLTLLAALTPAFAALKDLQTQQLRFDAEKGELRLSMTADSFQTFDRFRALAPAQLEIQPGDMRSEDGRVRGSLLVRSKQQ